MTVRPALDAPLVATLVWDPSELHAAQGHALQRLGYRHCFMDFNAPIPSGVDAVVVQGPGGSLAPLAHQLRMQPPEARPLLLYWFAESLDLQAPAWVSRLATGVFSDLHHGRRMIALLGKLTRRGAPGLVRRRGTRLGFMGDLRWLHTHGLPAVLATSGTVYAEHLSTQGIASIVVPRGYHASYGERRDTPRDIHLLWMGKLRTRRRRAAVRRLQEEMRHRGLAMHVCDGESRPFVFGEQRTELLNRAWFVLNVNAYAPSDELSIRHFISASNGAVVVTEPNANRYPWQAGRHLIECPVAEMPERIAHLVAHPDQWRALADNMHQLITQELTLEHSLVQILAAAQLDLPRPAVTAAVDVAGLGAPRTKGWAAVVHGD
jgi:hypothetical protein